MCMHTPHLYPSPTLHVPHHAANDHKGGTTGALVSPHERSSGRASTSTSAICAYWTNLSTFGIIVFVVWKFGKPVSWFVTDVVVVVAVVCMWLRARQTELKQAHAENGLEQYNFPLL